MKCECGCLLETLQIVCEVCGREVFEKWLPKPDKDKPDLQRRAEEKIHKFIIQCKSKGLAS